ncbi:M28 family metallopeptidase, partial [Bacteroidota bacterium]
MRKLSILIVLPLIFVSSLYAQTGQVSITDVVDRINQDSVRSYIEHLQNYGTRFMLAPNRFEIANWIKAKFESWGFTNVELDSFWCHTEVSALPFTNYHVDTTTMQVNVVATLEGSENPEVEYIIGGHYDSFTEDSDQFSAAPGADDNASGTAAVLESARAVMAAGYQPKTTLKFIAFGAEELMLFGDSGSEHYAQKARQNDTD